MLYTARESSEVAMGRLSGWRRWTEWIIQRPAFGVGVRQEVGNLVARNYQKFDALKVND